MAFFEVVGVGAILPFMKIVATPENTAGSVWVKGLQHLTGASDHGDLVVWSAILVFGLLLLGNLCRGVVGYLQQKIGWSISAALSSRLLKAYLSRGYDFYLTKNSSELKVSLLSEVNKFTTGVLIPLLSLISKGTLVVVIAALLFYVDPLLSFVSVLVLGGLFLLIYWWRRRALSKLGEKRVESNVRRYGSLIELFSGIKTFMVYGVEGFFYQRFSRAAHDFSEVQPSMFVISQTPRLGMEVLLFGGLLGMTTYLYFSLGDISEALPILSLYALAGVKLLPSLQAVYVAATSLRHHANTVDALYADFHHPQNGSAIVVTEELAPQRLQSSIALEGLSFSYENSDSPALRDINLKIEKGTTVAFVGSTGSGKSTMADILVGLLRPSAGFLLLDGVALTPEDTPAWQKGIAYVPQDVVLFDDTVLHNIAIGEATDSIDRERAYAAARVANIHTFITDELAQGYATKVGERGARISGGQKQRIGLARALYRRPEVLVLDEATSALDNVTEQAVLTSLAGSDRQLTTIVIAHRLATIRHADCIYLLDHGELVGQGTYQELVDTNADFREMARLN
ncbi:hypothetical protein A3850_003820 [Lewinella sp. 4G2]|nr:hypothetical protein A3850_003820 [Lewinella sp. 4G2]